MAQSECLARAMSRIAAAVAAAAICCTFGRLTFLAPASEPALRGRAPTLRNPSRAQGHAGEGFGLVFGGAALALCVAVRRRQEDRSLTSVCAVTEVAQVKLSKIMGGKATPAPPVGPAIGAFGLNIAMFVKEYNALTADKVGQTCPCIVHVMSDKSFKIELKTPLTAALLHKAVNKQKGSGKAGTDIIGSISIEKLEEIAQLKLPDLNCEDITRAMKIVHGTAVASGIKVDGYEEWLEKAVPKPKTIMDRYGPGVARLPAPWGEGPPLADTGDDAAAEAVPEEAVPEEA